MQAAVCMCLYLVYDTLTPIRHLLAFNLFAIFCRCSFPFNGHFAADALGNERTGADVDDDDDRASAWNENKQPKSNPMETVQEQGKQKQDRRRQIRRSCDARSLLITYLKDNT